ncbi:MAG: alanine--tRNA ligase [Ruminococcus sp.]|nr:alanine--tRNA ligase [Ruminococcus sp.]MDE6848943.1 alanine--tRNA ligase [Ruminococcus sp.]
MKWNGLNELREKYLSFFESKNHTRMASASLVPQGDKSLLLINSGMAPLKKYFLGQAVPPNKRVTTCQKCIRTPDIESVGKTARHGTYFEMLGNFSFGDYFKNEAVEWAWEFLTKILEIPADKLWITIFESDDEAEQIWENKIGIPHERIIRLGKKDNFWEHGSGPCGPCSEIHFDRVAGGRKLDRAEFEAEGDKDNIIEIWNLVFSQFDSDGNGNYAEMKNKNIDTGMGLERLACVMQGVDNIFEVDTVQNIMKHVSEFAGVTYKENPKTDVSLRVITDHIRSTTFMVGDGIMPSNEGRGYVLRRLLRRAARHGRLLGIKKPFLCEVADTVINENAGAYPELAEKRDYIKKIIGVEEEAFAKTVDKGSELLAQFTEKLSQENKTVLSGDDAFRLSDTYGFPIDLTIEICEEKGITVDTERFTELAKEQRAKAKADHLAKAGSSWADNSIKVEAPATVFTGYTDTEADSEVLAVYKNGQEIETAVEGDNVVIVLDRTPFYAESGGQVGDTGIISTDADVVTVLDTVKSEGHFMHIAEVTSGSISKGYKVKAQIDVNRRRAIMRNHTSAHLLQYALRQVLGDHVHQAGQLVNDKACRFDFNHFSGLTEDEITQVENYVNNEIMKAVSVTMEEMPIEEAKKLGAMALFGEKYGDTVRVVTAGDSIEFCGGTHIGNTSEIGLFRIVSESSVAAGIRRIEAVTGMGVIELLNSYRNTILKSAKALKLANVTELPEKCASVFAESKEKDRKLESLSQQIANAKISSVFDNAQEINGVKLVSARMDGSAPDALRKLGDSVKDKNEAIIALFAGITGEKGTLYCVCTKEAVAKGANAGKIVREISVLTGGKGGGKPDSAMAGIGDITKTDSAMNEFVSVAGGFIK